MQNTLDLKAALIQNRIDKVVKTNVVEKTRVKVVPPMLYYHLPQPKPEAIKVDTYV